MGCGPVVMLGVTNNYARVPFQLDQQMIETVEDYVTNRLTRGGGHFFAEVLMNIREASTQKCLEALRNYYQTTQSREQPSVNLFHRLNFDTIIRRVADANLS